MEAESVKTGELGELPQLITPKQAARILGVHERTVVSMCARGELKAVKVRSLWRINRAALMASVGLEA